MPGVDSIQGVINLFDELLELEMEDFVRDAAGEQGGMMADLTREQLRRGERSDGTAIDPPYRPFTIRQKQKAGRPYNIVTLYDRGHFYAGIQYDAYAQYLEGKSTDIKDEGLQRKYGDQILGLQAENIVAVSQAMVPDLIGMVRKHFKI